MSQAVWRKCGAPFQTYGKNATAFAVNTHEVNGEVCSKENVVLLTNMPPGRIAAQHHALVLVVV